MIFGEQIIEGFFELWYVVPMENESSARFGGGDAISLSLKTDVETVDQMQRVYENLLAVSRETRRKQSVMAALHGDEPRY